MNSEKSSPDNGRTRCSGSRFIHRLLTAACIAAALTPGLAQAAAVFPLSYSTGNEPMVNLPYSISYPAHGNASIAAMGSNLSAATFTVDVISVATGSPVFFGVANSDTAQGVPWDDAGGLLTDGGIKSWAIDTSTGTTAGVRKITITFATPVTAVKFAVTDIDISGEQVLVQAFPVTSGGSAIALTDHNLTNPTSVPSLAQGVAHAGNDAYVVDQSKVTAAGGGVYANAVSANVHDSSASVLFAYDDSQPVGRIEISYTNTSNSGIWIAGLSFNDPVPPVASTAVPTLSQWGLILLSLLLAGLAMFKRNESIAPFNQGEK